MRVYRVYDVTFPTAQEEAIKARFDGTIPGELLLVITEYADLGELKELYYVEYKHSNGGENMFVWGNYNDVMIGNIGEDTIVHFKVEDYQVDELATQYGECRI